MRAEPAGRKTIPLSQESGEGGRSKLSPAPDGPPTGRVSKGLPRYGASRPLGMREGRRPGREEEIPPPMEWERAGAGVEGRWTRRLRGTPREPPSPRGGEGRFLPVSRAGAPDGARKESPFPGGGRGSVCRRVRRGAGDVRRRRERPSMGRGDSLRQRGAETYPICAIHVKNEMKKIGRRTANVRNRPAAPEHEAPRRRDTPRPPSPLSPWGRGARNAPAERGSLLPRKWERGRGARRQRPAGSSRRRTSVPASAALPSARSKGIRRYSSSAMGSAPAASRMRTTAGPPPTAAAT